MNGTVWTNTRGTHTATTMANGHITPCYHNHRNHYKVRQSIYIVTMHKIVKLKQISSNKIAYRFWACSKLKERKRESDWVKCQIICVERRDCFARFFCLVFFSFAAPMYFVYFFSVHHHLLDIWWIDDICTRRASNTKDYFVTYREYLMKDSLWSRVLRANVCWELKDLFPLASNSEYV